MSERREVCKEIWLFLLERRGAWFSGAELRQVLLLDPPQVYDALNGMFTTGAVEREGGFRKMKVRVTDRCRLPNVSFELWQLEKAMGIKK